MKKYISIVLRKRKNRMNEVKKKKEKETTELEESSGVKPILKLIVKITDESGLQSIQTKGQETPKPILKGKKPLSFDLIEDQSSKPLLKKRKSVRFNEITFMKNEENEIEEMEPAKGHFTVSDLLSQRDAEPSATPFPQAPLSSWSFSENPSSMDSNDTLILEEYEEDPNRTIDATKSSFYEYDSILFPKTSKFIDCLSFATQEMSTIIESDEPQVRINE